MKLSKSKPSLKHKKIFSLNINSLKNSCIQSKEEEEDIKDNDNKIIEDDKNKFNNNQNNQNIINNNDLGISQNSSQLDWVNREIEVKTKNNQIIKLSLENDNFYDQSKIKVNKLQKYKELYNNKDKQINKNYNKESGYMMVSTKESEIDTNFKYLSNRKNKNAEISYPDSLKKNDENNEEDMVNMKTLTIFNVNNDITKGNNNILDKNKIYKKRIKTGFLNFKNNSKKAIKPIISETRNNNYLSKNIKFFTNNGKESMFIESNKINSKMMSFYIGDKNKNVYKKNISFKNIREFDNNDLSSYNNNLNNTTTNYITPYSNYKNKINKNINTNEFQIKEDEYLNYLNTRKTNINSNNINNNNTKFQTYKFITPSKIKTIQKYSPATKFIKKKVSQKYLLLSHNKSDIILSNFLSQINLQKYYAILKINGFDNINLLIEQMRSNIPIQDSELKKAGIRIPGDRAKILIRLEEKGNVFPFLVPKNVYYSLEHNLDEISINKDQNIIQLKRWLKEFKMEEYLKNFIENGYYSVELFLFQMISKNPISDDILQYDIGIEKIGHRSRILSILKEESKKMKEKMEHKEIIFTDETKDCGCFAY